MTQTWLTLLIGFLTFILVVDCLFLMLLILIQLPKKEAGAGIAFGGAATDALFGAGSGNALTKMTKYSATIFLGLALGLSLLNSHEAQQRNRKLEKILQEKANAAAPIPPPSPAAGSVSQTPGAPTQALQSAAAGAPTNPPVSIATNGIAAVPKNAATNPPLQTATNQKPAVVNPATTNSSGAKPQ